LHNVHFSLTASVEDRSIVDLSINRLSGIGVAATSIHAESAFSLF
jgi:hypothetical protein